MTSTRLCRKCRANTLHNLTRQLFPNDTEQVGWRCSACHGWSLPTDSACIWIDKEKLAEHGVDPETLPTLLPELKSRCAVCGARGAELHHWAPRGLFGEDADKWPTDFLCRPCHMKWHALMTPQLMRRTP